MKTHPHLHELRAYAAAELDVATKHRTSAHVLECTECRDTLQWLDDVRAAAQADVPPPAPDAWTRIAARIDSGEVVLLPAEDSGHAAPDGDVAPEATGAAQPPRRLHGWRVAAVALLLAGGAAAAAPDGWLRTAINAVMGHRADAGLTQPPADAEASDAAPAPHSVALLVEPSQGSVLISLTQPHEGVRVHLRMVDAGELQVEAYAGVAAATFRTSPGRLEVVGGDSGTVVLTVPMSLGRVQVDVEGRTLMLKERGEIRILAPSADTVGSEFVLPVRSVITRPR